MDSEERYEGQVCKCEHCSEMFEKRDDSHIRPWRRFSSLCLSCRRYELTKLNARKLGGKRYAIWIMRQLKGWRQLV